MTPLRQRMIDDMGIRNLSLTQNSYVGHVSLFAHHFGRSRVSLFVPVMAGLYVRRAFLSQGRCRSLRHLVCPAAAAPALVFLTENLPAQDAALPCLSPKGLIPARGMDTDILHAEGV